MFISANHERGESNVRIEVALEHADMDKGEIGALWPENLAGMSQDQMGGETYDRSWADRARQTMC